MVTSNKYASQAIKFQTDSQCFTEFSIPEFKLSVIPFPGKSSLKGTNAGLYTLTEVKLNF